MRILVVQDADWGAKGPHQQHHLFERLQIMGHHIRIIDYETFWKRNLTGGILARRKEYYASGKVVSTSRLLVVRPTMLRIPLLCYLTTLLFNYFEIRKQISEFRPDVIVGWGLLSSLVSLRVAKEYGIPFVFYVIDSLHSLIPERLFRGVGLFIERYLASHADKVFVISKYLAEYVHRLGTPKDRIHVLSAGVDFNRFNPQIDGKAIRSRYGIRNDDIVLFFMGNMFPFSGLKELAEELIERSDAPNVKLLLLGRGELFSELEELGKKPKARGRIVLVDWVDYDDVPMYVAAADLTLLPAQANKTMQYALPIKTYEYLACGKPLITTKLPGMIKEFGSNSGVLYVDSASEIVDLAIELQSHPEILRQISESAVQFVRPLDWCKLTRRFERLLERTIRENETRPHSSSEIFG